MSEVFPGNPENMPVSGIEQDTIARLAMPNGSTTPVSTTMGYERDDPLAVHFTFDLVDPKTGKKIEWEFARSLLADATATEAGEVAGENHGHMHVTGTEEDVYLDLHNLKGQARFAFDREAIEIFLADTNKLVPDEETAQRIIDSRFTAEVPDVFDHPGTIYTKED